MLTVFILFIVGFALMLILPLFGKSNSNSQASEKSVFDMVDPELGRQMRALADKPMTHAQLEREIGKLAGQQTQSNERQILKAMGKTDAEIDAYQNVR